MKKILIISTVILFAASSVFAVPFSPTLLKLKVPARITYNFDNTQLQIPVTVVGKPSNSIFMIYTKDKAAEIGKVRNGLLGWHTVNKLDTCVYMAPPIKMITGTNTITWDGKNNYGAVVPAGAYTYYLFGYDNQNPKEFAQRNVSISWLNIEGRDLKGVPLASPNIYVSMTGGIRKWVVGIDPSTAAAALETSTSGRTNIPRFGFDITLDPTDHGLFWQTEKDANNTLYVTKYKWSPNGSSTVETKWADSGSFTWVTRTNKISQDTLAGDNKGLLFNGYCYNQGKTADSQVVFLTMADGTQERIVDLTPWYSNQADSDKGGQMNSGPMRFTFRNGHLFTHGDDTCMCLALDPSRDVGDEIYWVNGNGDFVHDHHEFLPDSNPWMCNDYNVGPYMSSFSTDANEFCTFNAALIGVATFGLIGPGGTGIGYFGVAGETLRQINGNKILDEDTAYDGLYTDNVSQELSTDRSGCSFIGQDSIKGVITNAIGVEEVAPAAFSVAQNSPNPFNPTTTISFTLAKAGKVTVDIYNAAGQKIDTVVNTTMSAGNHSATWNASKFSAGVYFYTVRSGDFSKTMKMTLLK